MAARINARLDDELATRVRRSCQATGMSTSEFLKQALEHACAEQEATPTRPYPALMAAGFIGCADGPADLSSSYKAELAPSLAAKHGLGVPEAGVGSGRGRPSKKRRPGRVATRRVGATKQGR